MQFLQQQNQPARFATADAHDMCPENSEVGAALTAALLNCDVPLSRPWVFWATWRLENHHVNVNETTPLSTCSDVKTFWEAFGQLTVVDMPVNISLHVFQPGIVPVYDHPDNKSGGHFKVRAVSVASASNLWLQVCLAVILDRVPHGDQINGVTIVKKTRSITIQLWVANSLNKLVVDTLKMFLNASLSQEDYFRIKFCPHKYLIRTVQAKQLEKERQRTSIATTNSDSGEESPTATAPYDMYSMPIDNTRQSFPFQFSTQYVL